MTPSGQAVCLGLVLRLRCSWTSLIEFAAFAFIDHVPAVQPFKVKGLNAGLVHPIEAEQSLANNRDLIRFIPETAGFKTERVVNKLCSWRLATLENI